MEVSIPAGAQPVVPQPERTPVAVRTAVARLNVTVLPRFEAEWTAATVRARDEYSVMRSGTSSRSGGCGSQSAGGRNWQRDCASASIARRRLLT
jgi:hypothetical protein